MSTDLKCVRVFIASPSGLEKERKAFRDELRELNSSDAIERGVYFLPVGGEEALGGIGRPQLLINEEVRRSDYFVLVLWNRWGTPPGDPGGSFTSGTEEEYHVALECQKSKEAPMRQLLVLFRAVDPQQLADAGPDLTRVLEFKKTLESNHTLLYKTFGSISSFRSLLRHHLSAWLRGDREGPAPSASDTPALSVRQATSELDITQVERTAAEGQSELHHAWELADAGKTTEAEVEFSRAVVSQSSPTPLLEYGRFLVRLGRLDQAKVMFEQASARAESQGDEGSAAVSLAAVNIGTILQTRGELDGAEQMYRQALAIDERLGRPIRIASDFRDLGNLLRLRSDLDGAEQMYRKALEIDERLDLPEGAAGDYGNLGNVLRIRGDLQGAERMHRRAIEIFERLNHPEAAAMQYGNLGLVLRLQNDLVGAEQMHRKAIEINERLNRLEGMANQYGNLGTVLGARNDLEGAEQMYRKSLAIAERLGHLEGMAAAYGNLGTVLHATGDIDGSEEMYRKSLAIEERLGHLAGMAADYGNLGTLLHDKGDVQGAEEMYRLSLGLNERLGALEGLANAYSNFGKLLRDRRDLAGAAQMYRKMLEIELLLRVPDRIEAARALLAQLDDDGSSGAGVH